MAYVRKKIYIDQSVQGALLKRIILHWCAFIGLALICLLAFEYFMGDPQLTFGGHLQVIWQKYAFFFMLMLAIVPSFVYDTIKLSHRFAGPILRLRNSIHSLAEGENVREIHFREGDFWMELASDFNKVAKRLNEFEETADAAEPNAAIDVAEPAAVEATAS